jgi:hypothetical protein
MANHIERGDDIAAYDVETNAGLACLWARWPEGRKQRLRDQIPAMMEESAHAVEQGSL